MLTCGRWGGPRGWALDIGSKDPQFKPHRQLFLLFLLRSFQNNWSCSTETNRIHILRPGLQKLILNLNFLVHCGFKYQRRPWCDLLAAVVAQWHSGRAHACGAKLLMSLVPNLLDAGLYLLFSILSFFIQVPPRYATLLISNETYG